MFHTKVVGFEQCIKWRDLFNFEYKYGGALKISFKILSGNSYFLFDILIADTFIFLDT